MNDKLIPVPASVARRAHIDAAKYKAMYDASIADPAKFWGEHGKRIDWIRPYSPGCVRDVDYTGNVRIRWFYDGTLNVSANCVDRHLAKRADQTAILWEGDDPKESKHVTYRELHELAPAGDASAALARLYASLGEHALAAEWLEIRLGSAPQEQRATTAVALARAHIDAGQDRCIECVFQVCDQRDLGAESGKGA